MTKVSRHSLIIAVGIIFVSALAVRLLTLHDVYKEVWKVQAVVVNDYKYIARLLLQGGVSGFFNPSSPLSDPNTLGHPPGYSILLAIVFKAIGESDVATQLIHITADALSAVLIFLIAINLISRSAAFVAGMCAALSPQFAWNSVLLLPDSLAVLPILLAVYFLNRARMRPRFVTLMAAGACAGLSCWLRANALLLVPFLAIAALLLFERGRRLRYALAVICGGILVIAPLTIRNAIVFHHFIPLSLGAGQTLLTGLADYDTEGRFGLPITDMELLKNEAEIYNRPDYYGTYFNPDGIKRERLRIARSFAIIRSHPAWFLGVMARRATSILRLERARLVSAEPPVTHSLSLTDETQLAWRSSPAEFVANGVAASSQVNAVVTPDGQALQITGDDSTYGRQIVSAPISIQKNTDYLLTLPVKIERGRMTIGIASATRNLIYGTTTIETLEAKTPEEQPEQIAQLPFVSGRADQVQVVLSNEASKPGNPVVKMGEVRLFALGPASYVWTRFPRALIRTVQKLFLTSVMLPLAIIGIALLGWAKQGRTLVILLTVPAYYLCVQSAVHTEYRYVLAVHYFLFTLAAITLTRAGGALWRRLPQIKGRVSSASLSANTE